MSRATASARVGRQLVVLVAALPLLLTACGSASSTASSSTGASGTTDPAVVSGAQQLVSAGVGGMVSAAKPENDMTLADWKPVTGWTPPAMTVATPKAKKVYVIACVAVAPFCNDVAQGAVDAAKKIGWDATFLDGKGTPQGFADAFQTAIAGKPDAILTMAIPESVAGTYIADARSKGIKTIGISSVSESGVPAARKYDAYISARENPNAQLEAWWTIADSAGKANVAYIWDPAFPFLVESLAAARKVFSQCSGCTIAEVVNSDIPTLADPGKAQQVAVSLLQRHPKVNYVLLPYGIGTRSVIDAAKSLGRDIKVVNKNSDPVNIGLVHDGLLSQENGTSPAMAGWAGVDQAIRVLGGGKPLADWEPNLPMHIYVKSNAPASGTFDWDKATDYKSKYLQLWGATK